MDFFSLLKKIARLRLRDVFGHQLFFKIAVILCIFSFIFARVQQNRFFAHLNLPLISPNSSLAPLESSKTNHEVFGFAPYWTINKLDNVDFDTLTTLSYFGVPVDAEGDLVKDDYGYIVFKSRVATQLFTKAHSHGTRVVLTLTQMDNTTIRAFLDDNEAQENAISQAVSEVYDRGIDGINIDFEYAGNPGYGYSEKFSTFVGNITSAMHKKVPNSKVTVSVYAGAVKDKKLYEIKTIAENSDAIFMMAYDFATTSADNAIPTAPLYGHREGKYWYDISTAVDDFLTQMPAEKLILGLPWYGYNYLVDKPQIKAETLPYYSWKGKPSVQTYAVATESIGPNMEGVSEYKTGWDKYGEVGWKAYYKEDTDTWRMIFLDDEKSLGIKYEFAKEKKLAGVGMWALGFDEGKKELWEVLREKFGTKIADENAHKRRIAGNI